MKINNESEYKDANEEMEILLKRGVLNHTEAEADRLKELMDMIAEWEGCAPESIPEMPEDAPPLQEILGEPLYLTVVEIGAYFGTILMAGDFSLIPPIGNRENIIKLMGFSLAESTIEQEGAKGFKITIHLLTSNGSLDSYKTGHPTGIPLEINGIEIGDLWLGEMIKEDFLNDYPATEDITELCWERAEQFTNEES